MKSAYEGDGLPCALFLFALFFSVAIIWITVFAFLAQYLGG